MNPADSQPTSQLSSQMDVDMPSAEVSKASVQTKVGVAVEIENNGEVLLGKRLGSHGAGTWAYPGGHLEPCESFATCAAREVLEETGLKVNMVGHLGVTNDVFEPESPGLPVKHYVTVFVRCRLEDPDAEPKVLEPEKCAEWKWFVKEDVDIWAREQYEQGPELQGPKLFLPLVNLHGYIDYCLRAQEEEDRIRYGKEVGNGAK